MEGSVIDLSRYRFDKAKDDLESAKMLFKEGQLKASINRSYYAIFHALRAVTALDSFDSKKHSGIIAYFNERYIKPGTFDKSSSKLIAAAFKLRGGADYEDFYVVSVEQAQGQINDAETIMGMVSPYLEERWGKAEGR